MKNNEIFVRFCPKCGSEVLGKSLESNGKEGYVFRDKMFEL